MPYVPAALKRFSMDSANAPPMSGSVPLPNSSMSSRLRGIGSEVVVANTPSFRGMVKKVLHLVDIQEVEVQESKKK